MEIFCIDVVFMECGIWHWCIELVDGNCKWNMRNYSVSKSSVAPLTLTWHLWHSPGTSVCFCVQFDTRLKLHSFTVQSAAENCDVRTEYVTGQQILIRCAWLGLGRLALSQGKIERGQITARVPAKSSRYSMERGTYTLHMCLTPFVSHSKIHFSTKVFDSHHLTESESGNCID